MVLDPWDQGPGSRESCPLVVISMFFLRQKEIKKQLTQHHPTPDDQAPRHPTPIVPNTDNQTDRFSHRQYHVHRHGIHPRGQPVHPPNTETLSDEVESESKHGRRNEKLVPVKVFGGGERSWRFSEKSREEGS